MTDVAAHKAAAREKAFASRAQAHAAGGDEAANRNLIGHLALFSQVQIIAGYMPMRTEISPLATMTILHGQGKRICVPVIEGAGRPLKFAEWTPEAEMQAGPFGALVPADAGYLEPELLITPLVAFDRQGYRLGYGGGYYDRSFAELRRKRTTWGIGFAYAGQEVKAVPREATDQQLDALVTQTEILRFDR
jgi:5-formyltetrahydrofolate cyclo-ligase